MMYPGVAEGACIYTHTKSHTHTKRHKFSHKTHSYIQRKRCVVVHILVCACVDREEKRGEGMKEDALLIVKQLCVRRHLFRHIMGNVSQRPEFHTCKQPETCIDQSRNHANKVNITYSRWFCSDIYGREIVKVEKYYEDNWSKRTVKEKIREAERITTKDQKHNMEMILSISRIIYQ